MFSIDTLRGYSDIMILSILYEKDSYGYEISKEIRRRTQQQYHIKETTLYSAFTRLEKKGFLVSYLGEETFGKSRNYLRITSAGKEYYREKCIEWELTKAVIEQFVMEGL